jgi:hypothetical protein
MSCREKLFFRKTLKKSPGQEVGLVNLRHTTDTACMMSSATNSRGTFLRNCCGLEFRQPADPSQQAPFLGIEDSAGRQLNRQLNKVIYQKPGQRMTPDQQRPTPADGRHKHPRNTHTVIYSRAQILVVEEGLQDHRMTLVFGFIIALRGHVSFLRCSALSSG